MHSRQTEGLKEGKRQIPSHILIARMHSYWVMVKPRLGLKIVHHHVSVEGDDVVFQASLVYVIEAESMHATGESFAVSSVAD